ncbi:TonB-dependent receptor domain-containing protein [Methylopila musalis]|uniref:TonB-dependent receptor domain-containing protein n=1 Tax=Methylopila musalis TaxID=1134781 RepID=A0ABW3Z387_9HYPH
MSNGRGSVRLRNTLAGFMAGASVLTLSTAGLVQAQTSTAVAHLDIPAQSLSDALVVFSRQTQIEIFAPSALAAGKRSNAVSGAMTPAAALDRLLTGAGLSYSFTNANTVTITRPAAEASAPPPDDGSLLLDAITVTGTGGESSVYTPYETPGAASHISAERIERFRGSSPSDIFRGTPGVMSGDSRNSAGAIDVNVRGLQGMGRVRVTVDDAENAVTVYQGYQGQTNRTYIDPDFIAGIDIHKGADVASRGAAGTVAMRTLSANDIVKEGDTWGVRAKTGFGTNTSKPNDGATGGYAWPTSRLDSPVASSDGLDRPSVLKPSSGSASFVAAVKEENWDVLAGYAYRKQGNYHAGKKNANGAAVDPTAVAINNPDGTSYTEWRNAGYTNYRPGEEVLNTSLETQSFLIKGNMRFTDDHSLQYTYNNFRSEGGYMLPIFGATTRPEQNRYGSTTGTKLDTGTLRYRWNPADNDLIDLKVGGWMTYFQLLNDPRLVSSTWPETLGLSEKYRTGVNTLMWGADVANTSKLSFENSGGVDLTYGLSYIGQSVRLGRYAEYMSFSRPSQGERDEVAGFAKAAYTPVDWLTLNAGLRYSHYWSDGPHVYTTEPPRDAGGWSPSLGVTVEPVTGVQLYANYASTLRLPSLVETVGLFTIVEAGLKPERLRSLDLGVNLTRDGVFADSDRGMVKFGWFNWDVKDYISRATQEVEDGTALRIHNIHSAKFSGLEVSGRYEIGGFTADIAANYFTKVEYCVTAATCGNMSLYGDYATNHVPPEYMIDVTLSQKLFEDRLTVGGRGYHVGPRAAGHGDVTSQGYSSFITQVRWKPFTLFDAFAEYKINETYTAAIRVENLTDQFYIDPLGNIPQPGPGRTLYASLTGTFGGGQSLPALSSPFHGEDGTAAIDWSGAYAGFHGGFGQARTKGKTSVLDPTADDFGGRAGEIAASESADLDFGGGLLGLQAGYNWQFKNRVVLGFEAEWSRSWVDGRQDNRALDDQNVIDAGWLQSRTHHEIDWTASLRARLGYAFDNGLMLYGAAGVAVLKEKVARDQYRITGQGYANPGGTANTITWVDQDTATRVGFTAGFGGEYALNERWSLKTEYTFSRLRTKDYAFANAHAGAGEDYVTREVVGVTPVGSPQYSYTNNDGGYKTVNGRSASNSLDLHAFKVGLNYRF